MNYFAQAIGFVGMLFAFISFQRNNNKGILFFQIMATTAFIFHFLLLGAYTGAMMNLLGALRNIVFFYKEKKWASKRYWLYLFNVLYIVCGIMTWKGLYSLLPMVAMVVSTIGLWLNNPRHTRFLVFPSSPCWLVYNIITNSIAGIFTEIFVLCSLTIGIIRFDIIKSGNKGRTEKV